MRSLNLKFIENVRLNLAQASALKKIGEYKGMQALFARQTPEVLDSLRRVARIESSESSNRIEGVTAPGNALPAVKVRCAGHAPIVFVPPAGAAWDDLFIRLSR